MRYQAIVHAPNLRVGARLNIAVGDQPPQGRSHPLEVGAEVNLRLGVCCPEQARGVVTGYVGGNPDLVVLTVGTTSWTLRKAGAGVTDPGLHSETWFVAAAVATP